LAKLGFQKSLLPMSISIARHIHSLQKRRPFLMLIFIELKKREEIIHMEMGLYTEGKDFFLVEWGMKFFEDIKNQVDPSYSFYQLKIVVNESHSADDGEKSRSYFLEQIPE